MKSPRVTINNLFAGYARAGLDPAAWYALSAEQQTKAQLAFIEVRARILYTLPNDPAYRLPGNVQAKAGELYRNAQEAMNALSAEDAHNALSLGIQAGLAMQGISTQLVAAEALDVTEQLQRPRSAGGKETARQKKEQEAANVSKAAEHWERLGNDNRPERERAAVIAERMGHPSDTVRRWIKKAGLR